MRWNRILSFLLPLLFACEAFAAFEIGANFSYKKTVYGSKRQNDLTSRTYSGSFNWYIFKYTALQLNYSYSNDVTTENNTIPVTSDVDIVGTQNRVNTQVYGVGLRQSFAPRRAFIRPSISLGYAKQIIEDQTDITYKDNSSGNTATVTSDITEREQDSVFGTFTLELKITQTLSLDGSVHTVFKAFEFEQAKDDMRYSVGFSWVFF